MVAELIPVVEAARRLGVTERTVERLCAAGVLRATQVGRAYVIDARHLESDYARRPPMGRRPRG